jgi:hypothetical protein
MISRRQEYYVKGLWALASRAGDEQSLRRMVRRIGKVDDISFLTRRSASALILALLKRALCASFLQQSEKSPKYFQTLIWFIFIFQLT